jgi:hypothetical protein
MPDNDQIIAPKEKSKVPFKPSNNKRTPSRQSKRYYLMAFLGA